jgi:hypothetical protein
MFTLTAMLSLLFALIIIGLIVYVLLWAIGAIGLPEPFNKIARVVVILFAAWWLITLLLPYTAFK